MMFGAGKAHLGLLCTATNGGLERANIDKTCAFWLRVSSVHLNPLPPQTPLLVDDEERSIGNPLGAEHLLRSKSTQSKCVTLFAEYPSWDGCKECLGTL